MSVIDKLYTEWAWRSKTGTPSMDNAEDRALLESIIAELTDGVVSEAENSSFDKIIEDTFAGKVPAVKGKYRLPEGTSKFEIDTADAEAFKALFFKAPDKSVGNGEVSLYWLFNYADPKNPGSRAKENRGADDPDLLVDGRGLEVKSYTSHNKKSTLGKFKSDVESRKIINALFGVTNLTKAFGEQEDFNSEVVFNMNTLKAAFEQTLRVKSVLEKEEVANTLKEYPIFQELLKQINTLLNLVEGGTAEELAKKAMVTLLRTKITKKPGPGNYIINMLPSNPTDAKIFRVPQDIEAGLMEKSFEHLAKNAGVNSAEIQFKYDIFD